MQSELTETFVLLRDWHAGDREALERLLARDLPFVRAYVVRRMGNLLRAKGEADDYVQEAAIEALRYVPRFVMSDRDQFRALLARITENVLRDNVERLRARKRDVAREKSNVLNLDPPIGSATRPSQAAVRSEERQWVRLAIELLAPEERMLVIWREWDGLSFPVIAGRLGVSEDAARMRFTRSLPKLARTVQQLQRGEMGQLDAQA